VSTSLIPSLFTTTLLPFNFSKYKNMTIGIGSICEGGASIVLGFDTRASYEKKLKLGPNDFTSKAYRLPHGSFLLVAGMLHEGQTISSELGSRIGNLRENFQLDDIRNALNSARYRHRDHLADDKMRAKISLPLLDWQSLPLDSSILSEGKKIIDSIPIKAEVIFAGFKRAEAITEDSTPAILYRAIRKGPIESEINYTVIGSGSDTAIRVMNRRGQNIFLSWQQTSINVVAAIRAARRGHPREVGPMADLIIISQSDCMRLSPNEQIVLDLLKKTKKSKTTKMREFEDWENKELYHRLKPCTASSYPT
jgi:hypothetical protein